MSIAVAHPLVHRSFWCQEQDADAHVLLSNYVTAGKIGSFTLCAPMTARRELTESQHLRVPLLFAGGGRMFVDKFY